VTIIQSPPTPSMRACVCASYEYEYNQRTRLVDRRGVPKAAKE